MPRYKIFQVIFTNNEIASVKETEKPLIGFGGKKFVSCTRFHLIFAYVKTMSISKALKEAQNIIAEFLESQTNGEMDRKDIT